MIVNVLENGIFNPGKPTLLFEGLYHNVPGVSHDIGPDGRLLLLKPVSEKTTTAKLRVIENWFTELKRLAPPN